MKTLRVFIGYDSRQPIAYHVLSHSILRRASWPVSITPLSLSHLGAIYHRPSDPRASTEFTYTRFLVPFLCQYDGISVFMDCDMLCRADMWDLIALTQTSSHRVWVCQHDYTPSTPTKFLRQSQSVYPRKNWSSLMIFNNARCDALTPELVTVADAATLHQFQWMKDEEIGALPLDWNWLVGEYAPRADARLLHYTLGGPWFEEYADCDHADLWRVEYDHMRHCHG